MEAFGGSGKVLGPHRVILGRSLEEVSWGGLGWLLLFGAILLISTVETDFDRFSRRSPRWVITLSLVGQAGFAAFSVAGVPRTDWVVGLPLLYSALRSKRVLDLDRFHAVDDPRARPHFTAVLRPCRRP